METIEHNLIIMYAILTNIIFDLNFLDPII